MASNHPTQVDEIEKILICAQCLDIMKSPKTLPCTHSFCEECLHKYVDKTTVDGREGIYCSVCKNFSELGEFIDTFQIQELLELYWKCKKGIVLPCFMCESEENKVIWKCTDCKVTFCDGCQKMHKKLPNCKTHQCIPYNAESEQVIDANYYCKSHSNEVMNLFCRQCQKVICQKCKSANHATHISESIETTIASMSKQAKKSLQIIENHISKLHDENRNLKKQVDIVENEHSEQIDEYRTTKQELLAEIEQWEEETEEVLTEAKQENLKKLGKAIEVNEMQTKIKESVVKLTNATLTNIKGCSLIISLTNNVMRRLTHEEKVTHTEVNVSHPSWNKPTLTGLESATVQSTSSASSFDGQSFYSMGRIFDVDSMHKAINHLFKPEKNLQGNPCRLCPIDENIWIGSNCKSSGTFYIFHTSESRIESCWLRHDTGVRSFCQTLDDEVIATCETGLVLLDMDGKFVLKFSEDDYKDACIHNDTLFAILSGRSFLHIFEMQDGLWQFKQEVSMDYHFSGDDTTIAAHSCLYICVKGLSKILRYSLEGELIHEFGSKGTDLGEFHMPSICGIDEDGNLIVCDSRNDRIQVMTTYHTWLEYEVPEAQFPSDILQYNGHVFFLSGKKSKRKLSWCHEHNIYCM